MRGFAAIGLHNPKSPENVGSVMRAAYVYGAALVAIQGQRYTKSCTDVFNAWRHVPVLQGPDLHALIPHDCVPVAVDLVDGARDLTTYCHPERAFYVFGAEDATLGRKVIDWCRDVIYVPTRRCMNLAACVNVVLYDRMAKRGDRHVPTPGMAKRDVVASAP